MRIAILSRNRNLYSTRRLVEAIHQHNHEAVVIDVLRCYMNITSHKPTIHYHGKELNNINAIIPRIGASVSFYGTAVVRQFELRGVYSLNPSLGITHARDKLHSLQLLASQGIGLPITGFANQPGDIDDLTKMVGGAPLVVKFIEGTQGIGVVLAETRQAADSVIQAFMGLHVNILVQEYIKESNGADIRCFVIGGKVVASMKRQAAKGDFRSNIHRGGTGSLVEITEEERTAAIRSAQIMGLNVAGVDILRSHRGPVVIEVNATPGLEGIEKASGKDIAGMMVRHIESSLGFHPSTRAIS